jgi:DNA ligase-1
MAERKGIQLCYPFDEERLKKWTPPYIVQPKLDGERCRAVCDHGEVKLLSSSAQEIISVPHINNSLSRFCTNSPSMELDGELYIHDTSFEEISSIVSRTVNLHPNYERIEYHVFDIVNDKPQFERLRELEYIFEDVFKDLDYIKSVPWAIADDLDDVMKVYQRILYMKYEGIVVRHFLSSYIRKRSTYVMKFKPKKSDYYQIVGVNQMVDKNGQYKEMLGAIICSSDQGQIFSVGSGMNDEFRKRYFPMTEAQKLVGKIVHVQYQHITPGKGVPRFPVFVEIVDPMKGETCK